MLNVDFSLVSMRYCPLWLLEQLLFNVKLLKSKCILVNEL